MITVETLEKKNYPEWGAEKLLGRKKEALRLGEPNSDCPATYALLYCTEDFDLPSLGHSNRTTTDTLTLSQY